MQYFILTGAKDVVHPIEIQQIDDRVYRNNIDVEAFKKADELIVSYFIHEKETEICDVIEKPAYLISDALKRLFYLYEPAMLFKAIQLFSLTEGDNTAPLYWWPMIQEVDCLSDQSEKYGNGLVKNIVLDKEKIPETPIFRVGGILEHRVIVSLPVAESILRRAMIGVHLALVKIV